MNSKDVLYIDIHYDSRIKTFISRVNSIITFVFCWHLNRGGINIIQCLNINIVRILKS